MLMTIQAVFEHGVFRPLIPLSLPEGQRVYLQLCNLPEGQQMRLQSSGSENHDPVLEKMRAAKSIEELFAIVDSLPPDPDDDYDIIEALNENRRMSGEPPVYPGWEKPK